MAISSAHYLYGFVDKTQFPGDNSQELFKLIREKNRPAEDAPAPVTFNEYHGSAQRRHFVELGEIGNNPQVAYCAAFHACTNGQGFNLHRLTPETPTKTRQYKQKLMHFLKAIGIENPATYEPYWYLISNAE